MSAARRMREFARVFDRPGRHGYGCENDGDELTEPCPTCHPAPLGPHPDLTAHLLAADALDRLAALPAPARPTAEQIALVEKIREDSLVSATSQHRSFAEYHRKRADALTALLTAVTGKDTTP
jgi:hypothetical protein